MNKTKDNDQLYYRGTDIPIRLGDRIQYSGFFRKRLGSVVYVPGQSPLNKSMEYGDVKLWAIQLDGQDNDVRTMGYFPPDEVVPRKIKFISRDNSNQKKLIREDEEIE